MPPVYTVKPRTLVPPHCPFVPPPPFGARPFWAVLGAQDNLGMSFGDGLAVKICAHMILLKGIG